MTTCFSGAHFCDEAKNSRFKPHPVLMLLIFVGIFLGSQAAVSLPLIIAEVALALKFGDPDRLSDPNYLADEMLSNGIIGQWSTLWQLLLTIIPAALVILFCRLTEKRSAAGMGFVKRNCVKYYFAGLAIGAAEFAATLGISWLSGSATYEGMPGINVPVFALICVGWLIQGAEEEILCRGWFMTWLSARLPLWAAALINSAFFALLHIFNPGFNFIVFINLTLFGVFMSVVMLRFDSLIPCCAIHSIWNLVQGCVFGLPVSGITALPTVWDFELAEGRELWTGGVFGLEGSICETIVLTVFTLLMIFKPKKADEIKEV